MTSIELQLCDIQGRLFKLSVVLMCVYITGCSNDRKIIGDDFSNIIEKDFGEYLEVFDIYHSEDGEYNSYSFTKAFLKLNAAPLTSTYSGVPFSSLASTLVTLVII